MKILLDTSGIVDSLSSRSGLMNILNAGFKNIFIDLDSICSMELYKQNTGNNSKIKAYNEKCKNVEIMVDNPDKLKDFSDVVISKAKQTGLNTALMKAPTYPEKLKFDIYDNYVELVKESIKLASDTGYIVIDPIVKEDNYKSNLDFYRTVAKTAIECGVIILIRNIVKYFNGRNVRCDFSESAEISDFIDILNNEFSKEVFGFCFDIGTTAVTGHNVHEYILSMKDKIKAVIVRDCGNKKDSSVMPFLSGDTDIRNTISTLRSIEYDGFLIYGASGTFANIPLMLHPALLKFMKEISDFLSWQIELENNLKKYSKIVLFGAGNMCRNYMMIYGEKYPPLFTCDNNKEIWGTDFCGLEVKSPEVLSEISDDTAVFICNVYYYEIKEQLKKIGVKNIEFFNDEYLPKVKMKGFSL